MADLKLKAEKRKLAGRKVKQLRVKGILPANVYGKKIKSQALQVDQKEFEKIFKEAGETSIVYLLLGKEKRPVLIHNLQKDPVTDQIIHLDFYQVDLKAKVTTNIPIVLIGESPAEKAGLGTVVQQLDEIEVEALPTDLPEKFELDANKLETLEDTLTVADLNYDQKKVEVKAEKDQVLVNVQPLREEEEKPIPTEVEEAEAGEEKPAEEKEGEAKPEAKPAEAGEEKEKEKEA